MVWVTGGVPDTRTDLQRVERGVPGPVTQIARLITRHSLCAGMATRGARSGRDTRLTLSFRFCLTQAPVSDRMCVLEIRFTKAARRHRVGRTSVRFVMARTSPTGVATSHGSPGWLWVGPDERGRELEIVAVEVQGARDPDPVMLVLHVMPTHYRRERS